MPYAQKPKRVSTHTKPVSNALPESPENSIYIIARDTFFKNLKSPSTIVPAIADTTAVVKLVKDFGFGKYYIKGKYIIFKGNQRLRQWVKGTRYLRANTKIVKLGIGRAGAARSLKVSALASFVLVCAEEFWGLYQKGVYTLEEFGALGVRLGTAGTKTVIAALMGKLAVGYIAAAGTAAVAAPLIVAAGVAFAVYVALDFVDDYFNITPRLEQLIRLEMRKVQEAVHKVERTIHYIETNPQGYCYLERLFGVTGDCQPLW